jgi:UDP-glucose 4-epimerase
VRVLITGSSGQIGTNLALQLLEEGEEVIGADIRPNPWTEAVTTQLVDLRQGPGPMEAALAGMPIDVVVHLAAHAKVYELVEHPERALENVDMTFTALELARSRGVPFVFGSSREVYGEIRKIRQERPTNESDADFVVAESPYSASKIAGEALLASYHRCYGMPYLVFRFSNVYGRYDNDLERLERVVPLFIDRLRRGEPITIYGREKVLDFTYVDDCVAGVIQGVRKLTEGALHHATINLATGQGHSLGELVEYIVTELRRRGELRGEPQVTDEPTRPGEVTRYIADISQARRLLGYAPTTPLPEGIAKMLDWQASFRPAPGRKGAGGASRG